MPIFHITSHTCILFEQSFNIRSDNTVYVPFDYSICSWMMFPNTTTQPAHAEASIRYNPISSLTMNATERNGKIHLLTPIDPVAKHCIFFAMAVVTVLGFFGNVLVAFHLKAMQIKWQFRRNVNFTLRLLLSLLSFFSNFHFPPTNETDL